MVVIAVYRLRAAYTFVKQRALPGSGAAQGNRMGDSPDERIAIDIVNDLNERGLAPAKLAQWLLQHISNGDMKAEDWIALAQQETVGDSEARHDG